MLNSASISEPMIIDMVFAFSRGPYGTSKFKGDYPVDKRFGDEDNLRKAVNDGLVEKAIIKDDALVVGGHSYKIFDENDYVKIKIWKVTNDLRILHQQ